MPTHPHTPVVFFDLIGTLVQPTANGVRPGPHVDTLRRLGDTCRVGIVTNWTDAQLPGDVLQILEAVGVRHAVDPRAIFLARRAGVPLPDPRAFTMAAALAETSPHDCVFISVRPAWRVVAATTGMRTEGAGASFTVAPAAHGAETGFALAADGAAAPSPAGFALLDDEIDEDESPTYVLRGRVVPMTSPSRILEGGRVLVERGSIRAVLGSQDNLPSGFANTPVLDVEGTVYPGLIDLHNHFVYNVLPLWVVPQQYTNRSQWPRHAEYKSGVSKPIRDALAKYSASARAIVRYVEGKALIGGTTTGQGIRTQVRGGPKLFRGAIRNVENTDDPRLPEAGTRVPDLTVTGATGPERVESFRRSLERLEQAGASYFYHLSEGVDARARSHFLNLRDNDLLVGTLVGVHSLALRPDDLREMAAVGARVVWSPFSNLLLYGETHDLEALRDSRVHWSIGCDWSPTGSKNLLQELKVAAHENERQGGPMSAFALASGVTASAAQVARWGDRVGRLKEGFFADLLVLNGVDGDPFEQLIAAREMDVRLVTVHGNARYGEERWMEEMVTDHDRLEPFVVNGADKAFYFHSRRSPINATTFAGATSTLREAMDDLPGWVERMESENATLMSMGVEIPQEFVLDLDNEFAEEEDPLVEADDDEAAEFGLMADDVDMVESLPLDEPWVTGDDYWDRIGREPNISDELKAHLKDAYGVSR